ncbi:MAG TPA: sporulation integral membrane protein YlbJ [Spirochaetia bacterium]|nr:sporulation integral membrane protein YlbJ [Spirochaetia bacterium]
MPFIPATNPARGSHGRLFLAFSAMLLAVLMIARPAVVFAGATAGLHAWWNIVFPSLLPFFIVSELFMSLGVVHFLGELLEPVMRPVFNVPGAGSLVVAAGYTSGYPIGALLAARLRQEGLCSRCEGERLMSFTNNSSPLFMLVAVAVGMLGNPGVGALILGAHYLANFTLGLGLRFYGRGEEKGIRRTADGPVFARAWTAMRLRQAADTRPAGKILGDAVRTSLENLMNIGGFIVLFAVLIRLFTAAGMIGLLARWLAGPLGPLHLPQPLLTALASGFFEITMGSQLAAAAAASLSQKLLVIAVMLGWSGLCVHTQVATLIAGTDLRMSVFMVSRLIQSGLAAFYTALFLEHGRWGDLAWPALAAPGYHFTQLPGWLLTLEELGLFLALLVAALLFQLTRRMFLALSGKSKN